MAKMAGIQALDQEFASGKLSQAEYTTRRAQMVDDYNRHQAAVAAILAEASTPMPSNYYNADPYGMTPELAAAYNAPGPYDHLYNTAGYNATVPLPGKMPSYSRKLSPELAAAYRAPGRYDHLYNRKGYNDRVPSGTNPSYNTGLSPELAAAYRASGQYDHLYNKKGYDGKVPAGSNPSYSTKLTPEQAAAYQAPGQYAHLYNRKGYNNTVKPGKKPAYNTSGYSTVGPSGRVVTDAHGTSYLVDNSSAGYPTGAYDPNTGKVEGGTQVASPWLLVGKPKIEQHEKDKKASGLGALWTGGENFLFDKTLGGTKGLRYGLKLFGR
jgi:hypothetical protein